jgi:hypothetical protein
MRAIRARQIRRVAAAVAPYVEELDAHTEKEFTPKSLARRMRRRYSRRK